MKLQTIALAVALAATAGGSAFAAERDVTVRHLPDGTTIKHVVRHGDHWRSHRVVRRTVVIHRRYEPRRVVIVHPTHYYHHHHNHYVVNRRVTVVRHVG